jgi:hypothetical protein
MLVSKGARSNPGAFFIWLFVGRSLDIHAKITRVKAVQTGFSGANRAQKAEI